MTKRITLTDDEIEMLDGLLGEEIGDRLILSRDDDPEWHLSQMRIAARLREKVTGEKSPELEAERFAMMLGLKPR